MGKPHTFVYNAGTESFEPDPEGAWSKSDIVKIAKGETTIPDKEYRSKHIQAAKRWCDNEHHAIVAAEFVPGHGLVAREPIPGPENAFGAETFEVNYKGFSGTYYLRRDMDLNQQIVAALESAEDAGLDQWTQAQIAICFSHQFYKGKLEEEADGDILSGQIEKAKLYTEFNESAAEAEAALLNGIAGLRWAAGNAVHKAGLAVETPAQYKILEFVVELVGNDTCQADWKGRCTVELEELVVESI